MHRSLFRRVHPALLVVLCALALIGPALAIMTNGMAASLVLGQPDFTTNTTATSAEGMRGPFGLAVDPTTGKVFVTDTFNSRVLRFASVAALSNGAAAEGVLGQPDVTSSSGAAGASGLSFPHSLTVDSAGRLWVADTGNSRVLRFDNAARKPNGAPADGVLGQPDFSTRTQAVGASAKHRLNLQPLLNC